MMLHLQKMAVALKECPVSEFNSLYIGGIAHVLEITLDGKNNGPVIVFSAIFTLIGIMIRIKPMPVTAQGAGCEPPSPRLRRLRGAGCEERTSDFRLPA